LNAIQGSSARLRSELWQRLTAVLSISHGQESHSSRRKTPRLTASLNLICSVHRCLGCKRHNQLIGPRSHGVIRAFRNRIKTNMKNLSNATSRANLIDVTGETNCCSIRNFQPSLTTRPAFGPRRQPWQKASQAASFGSVRPYIYI
jgi:hypothetical protein